MMKKIKYILISILVSLFFNTGAFAAAKISIGAAVGGPNTLSVEIPFVFENDLNAANTVAVLDFEVKFDATELSFAGITALSALIDHDIDFEVIGTGNTLRIVIIPPATNTPIPTGTLAKLRFDLLSGRVSASQTLTVNVNGSFTDQSVALSGFNIVNGFIVVAGDSTIDSDGDGIPDLFEATNSLHPLDNVDAVGDLDGDGLTNLAEYQLGTNLYNTDTDGDGINDYTETTVAGLDPTINDSTVDTDGDGLTNLLEYQLNTNISVSDGIAIPANTDIAGQILVDTILLPEASYIATADLDVVNGAKLTIAPGASIKFSYTKGFTVNGELSVLGTESLKVKLTGADTGKGYWKGVVISNTGMANINHTDIEWVVDGVYFNGAAGSITNSRITNSSRNGINIINASPLIEKNILQFNTLGGISVSGVSNPSIISNLITNGSTGIALYGGLLPGRSPLPVITGNSLYNNTFVDLYAASYNDPSVQINATNNWWGTTEFPQIVENIFDHDTVLNIIPFLDSENGSPMFVNQLRGDWTGTPLTINTTYEVMDSFSVPAGESLAVPEGVKFRFYYKSTIFRVDGSLQVLGTSANPVKFTSGRLSTTSADWRGIEIMSTSSNVSIDYAVIEWAQNGMTFNNADGEVKNSTVKNNGIGLYLSQDSNPVVSPGNIITSNYHGIYVYYGLTLSGTNPTPLITGNSIYNNSAYDLYTFAFNDPSNTVFNVPDNWWGTTVLSDISTKIFDNSNNASFSPVVNFEPILTVSPTP